MLSYRLRERLIRFWAGVAPQFPDEAEVCVAFKPEPMFGGVPGETRSAITDRQLRLKVNLSTGRAVVASDAPLFDALEATQHIADTTFMLRKNVVMVRCVVSSLPDLADVVAAVFHGFPALLNVYSPDAPYATHAWGKIGAARFRWEFEPKEIVASTMVTSKTHQEDVATQCWRLLAHAAINRRLMGALIYFHTACRLLAVGQNRFEFAAEALLNFAKVLQALFGESRDDVRSTLKRLAIFEDAEIEAKFMSALVLRSEFDVAHVDFALLSRDQLRILHDYGDIAEDAFRKLFQQLLEKVESGAFSFHSDPPRTLPVDKVNILQRIQQNIQPYATR